MSVKHHLKPPAVSSSLPFSHDATRVPCASHLSHAHAHTLNTLDKVYRRLPPSSFSFSSCWQRWRLVAAPVFLSLQLRDMQSLKVESVPWWFLAEKQGGARHKSPHSLLCPLFFSFQSSLPESSLICSRKLGCTTGCWFTPTAGAPRGDLDPLRMSSKNNTLSWTEDKRGGAGTQQKWQVKSYKFAFTMNILFYCALWHPEIM